MKHSISGRVTPLIVYVDDIIVTGNDEKEKNTLKQWIAKEFEIKDLGKLKYFLGIEVARWTGGFARSSLDRRSTTSYCTFLGGNVVSWGWEGEKQNVVARSSAEVEFRAMVAGVCELL